jgi:hypothetical protein
MKKCINCNKLIEVTFPGEFYVHKVSRKTVCSDGYAYADPGDGSKVFGG